MKTSKIILISFLSVFCLGLLSFMITTEKPKNETQLEYINQKLPDFKVVRASKNANVTLITGDTCSIQYCILKDSAVKHPYEIVADTLFLKPLKHGSKNAHYSIYLNKVHKIINDGGNLGINLVQDSLNVTTINKGRLQFYDKSSLGVVHLKLYQNSKCFLFNDNIKNLILDANNSKININKRVSTVNLTAKNKANITLKSANTLSAKCDSSSRFRIIN